MRLNSLPTYSTINPKGNRRGREISEFPAVILIRGSLAAQTVKPACDEGDEVQSQGQEDPLEKGVATHSSIRAWRISWTEEPGGPRSTGSPRV